MLKLKRAEDFLIFLTILFLPTQLGRHFWPQFSYIYSLKVDYLSPTIYFWDLLIVGLFTLFIFQKRAVNAKALTIFLFFMFTQAASILAAQNIGAGLVRLEQYLIGGLFGLYLSAQDFKGLKKRIALPLIISILAESLLALAQVIKTAGLGFWILGERNFSITTPAIAKFDFYGIEFLRPYATFSHPNVLAAFLLIGIWFLTQLDNYKKIKNMAAVLALVGLILTFSRTAIFAAIFSSVLFLRKKPLAAALILITFLSPLLFIRFSSLFNYDSLTFLRREELAKASWEIFLQNPMLGVGLNNFIPTLSADIISGPNRFLQPVHNIFLLSLSETGLVGLVGFLTLIGYPILKLLKLNPKSCPQHTPFSEVNPLLLIWGIIVFLGLFDHYFLTLPQGIRLFFLVWGLSLPSMLK
ncbi:O-antigen ligase family protein [Candidatus Daviesbacteria bacterium]|nr:O-antigen ligase family protein [Candidatus Daviesbacteria bacterium]